MAAKKSVDQITRMTVKAQMFLWEFESFYYEKMYTKTFWANEDAEDTVDHERSAIFGKPTDPRFEDCSLEECRAYTEYLVLSSGITWDDFEESSMWDSEFIESFKKVKGKMSKGQKMTAAEIKKYVAAKKEPAKKSPATKKASAKKAPAKKKTPAKKTAAKKAPATKSAAVKKELAAKKVTEKKAAPKKTAAKKAPTAKAPKSPATKRTGMDKIDAINKKAAGKKAA